MVVFEAESADGWESVVSGCFVPLRCVGFETNFSGRMEHTALDDRLSVSLVTTCGTSAERTARLSDAAESDDIHVSLQRSSQGLITGNGRSTSVAPGSVSIYATDRPYFLDYSWRDQQQLIVQVSRRSLGIPLALLEDAMHRLSVPSGWNERSVRHVFTYARGLPDGADSPQSAEILRDLTAVMIRASFGEGSGVPRTSGGLRHAVREYFSEHHDEAGIDMDQVARRHHVSRRRLYQVFEEVGQSPATLLRGMRLRTAEGLLAAPSANTVEQIAYASGFRDATTFTRAFRREYDCTPREWRMRHQLDRERLAS